MKKNLPIRAALLAAMVLLGGCAQLYGGLQFAGQQQCNGIPDINDYRRCMSERSMPQDKYDRERAKAKSTE